MGYEDVFLTKKKLYTISVKGRQMFGGDGIFVE